MNNELFTCLFITVCYTGMRPGEACALTWNDVNLEKRIITIKHNVYPKVKDEKGKWFIGTPKTDTSNREIYICDTLFQVLHNFKSNQEKYKKYYNSKYHYYHLEEVKNKFGKVVEHRLIESKRKNRNQEIFNLVFVNKDGSYSGTDITKYPYKVIRNELGIINCRFYDLRGSYATKSLRNGADLRDVADTLGHSNVETTENYYVTSSFASRKEVSEKLEKTISSKVIEQIINKKD